MIEDVESLRTKLQLQSVVDWKSSPESHVHLPSSKPPREIAWSVTETRIHSSKGVGINRTASWTFLPWLKIPQPLKNRGAICAIEIDRLASNKTKSPVIQLPGGLQELISY